MKNEMEHYRVTIILVGLLHKNYKVDKKLGKKEVGLRGYQNKRDISGSFHSSKLEACLLEIEDREDLMITA